jgi:hypothetical protein
MAGEHLLHHRLILPPVFGVDERLIAATDRHQAGVHTGLRPERVSGNPSHQTEFEPRPPLGGHHGGAAHGRAPTGDLPLHQQHGVRPARTVQDAPQHRRRQVKRQVADDDVRRAGQTVVQEVRVDDARRGRSALVEARGPTDVDLDGRQRAPEFLQLQGERAVTGADLDDGTVGARDDVDNGVDDTAVVNEVLAEEFSPASGRCPQSAVMRG